MHGDVRRCGLRKGRKNKKTLIPPHYLHLVRNCHTNIDYNTTRDFSHNKVESPRRLSPHTQSHDGNVMQPQPLRRDSQIIEKTWLMILQPSNGQYIQNVFYKPNEQRQACLSSAMARKRTFKNVFYKPNEQRQACLSSAMARKRR